MSECGAQSSISAINSDTWLQRGALCRFQGDNAVSWPLIIAFDSWIQLKAMLI